MILNQKRLFTVALSVLVLAGFIATSLIGYFVARQSTIDQLQEQMLPLTSDNIYSEIQRDLLQPLLISSLMANDTFVVDWAKSGEQDPKSISDYLGQIQNKYDTITAFFVSEETRNYYHPNGIIKQVSESDPADAWYFEVREINDDYAINIDWDTADPNRLSIFVNYRVLDLEGNLIGVTGVGLSMELVSQLIENYQDRFGREIYFVDRQGEITLRSSAYQNEIYLQNEIGLDQVFSQIMSQTDASVIYSAKAGNTIYLNSRFVPEFDWYLIVEQINIPAAKKIHSALLINIAVSLVISIVVLLIAHFTLRNYQRRLELMATKDKLTGAASRQVFDLLFERTKKTALRRHETIALIMLDIDYFKSVNDTYGHAFGDEVLRQVAAMTTRLIRDTDMLCRWGGEEFLILLPDCKLQDAAEISDKVRLAIAAQPFFYRGESIQITISAGVVEYQPEERMEQLIERCDVALYDAKTQGRNQVRTA